MQKTASVLAKALTTNRILWAGFLGAVIVYGFTLEVIAASGSGLRGTPIGRSRAEQMPLSEDPLLAVIVLAAAGAAALGRIVPKLLLTPERLRAAAEDLRMERRFSKADLEEIAALPDMERRPFYLLGAWSTACILRWAAYDAVGVFGLVLALLRGSDPWVFAPFGAVSIALLLTARPDLEELHRLARSTRL